MQLSFIKMAGLGNDFIVLDARHAPLPALNWAKLADRTHGIGCDQVIVLEHSSKADVKMRIINADGSEVEACGNATRCIGWLLEKTEATIETLAGILNTRVVQEEKGSGAGAIVEVSMGEPQIFTRSLPIDGNPVEVSVGNPHLVFLVEDVEAVDVVGLGKPLEHHAAFPNRTNVEWAQVISPSHIVMRVWERGVGITQACGTGACAVAAAAIHRGLVASKVEVEMPGGSLWITWAGKGSSLLMQGAVSLTFRSELDVDKYAANA